MALTILPYLSPRLIIVDADATSISVQNLTDEIKEWEDDPLNLAYAKLVNTSGKENLGGGVFVGITAELQNAQLAFEQRPVSLFSGSSTVANAAGTNLTDTNSGLVNFIDIGVVPGDTIMNTTDKSVATILTVSASTITHFALEDGADNDWDFGDQYKIWSKVQCEVNGGNLVAVDENGSPISAFHPTAFTHVLRTAASSATLTEGSTPPTVAQIADGVWDEDLTNHNIDKTAGRVQQADFYHNSVVIDSVNGVAGTAWPIGTHDKPVSNLTDALTIIATRNIDHIYIHDNLTVTAADDVSELTIETMGIMGTTLTFATGCTANNTAVRYANVQGVITNGNVLLLESCTILDLSNFSGVMNVVAFGESAEVSIGSWATIIQATAGGGPASEPELTLNGAAVNMSHYTGNLKLLGKSGGPRTVINATSGNFIIDSTCTAGTIQFLGIGQIEADNSGAGCTVDIDGFLAVGNIADAIWDEALSGHINVGTSGKALTDVLQVEKGSWKIINNQLIMYELNGTTPLFTFNLLDTGGQPTSTNVVQRIKV